MLNADHENVIVIIVMVVIRIEYMTTGLVQWGVSDFSYISPPKLVVMIVIVRSKNNSHQDRNPGSCAVARLLLVLFQGFQISVRFPPIVLLLIIFVLITIVKIKS